MGYRHFIDLKEMALSKVPHGWGASDEQFFNYLKNRLKTARTPYSFQAISLSSHLPYDFVEGLWLRDFSKVQDPATRRYFNCISYVDSCLKNFFEGLDLSNTWIFVYGDHTPMDLQVSDDYKSSYVDIDGNHLEFVPLIILGPRLEARRIKTVASLLDIAPTVLKLSGVEYRGHLAGEDLISTGQLNKPLPFKGNYYNRDDLFHRVLASSR
jgi:phosphoglycerol transferase MdoB-like AlkP superfamily enzyme